MALSLKGLVRKTLGPPSVAVMRHTARFPLRTALARLGHSYLAYHPRRSVSETVFGGRMELDTSDFIQRFLYLFRVWEPSLTAFISRRLDEGDAFLDVGANLGYYTLLASSRVGPRGAVVAVEASPEIFALLEANLARNDVSNVRPLNVAAGAEEGVLPLFSGPDDNLAETTTLPESGFEPVCDVRSSPLDDVLRPDEAARLRLVKMDVEGAEYDALRGMQRLLEGGRRDLELIVEVNRWPSGKPGSRAEDIIGFLARFGFHAYCVKNDYEYESYAARSVEPPKRLAGPPTGLADVVFSRCDAAAL